MVVVVRVGRRRGRGRVGLVVRAEVVAALGRGAEVGAAAAQVDAVRGAGRRRRAGLEHLLEVRVGLHVARVCRRRPQLLVAARVGRRQRAVGVAERRQGGRALRVAAAALRAALRLAFFGTVVVYFGEQRVQLEGLGLVPGRGPRLVQHAVFTHCARD